MQPVCMIPDQFISIFYHQVQAMEVLHPKEGAVYWEGPVNVSLEVTLTGENISIFTFCSEGQSSSVPVIYIYICRRASFSFK